MYFIAALHVQGEKKTWHRIGAERTLDEAPRPFDNQQVAGRVAAELRAQHGQEDEFSLDRWEFNVVPAGACAVR